MALDRSRFPFRGTVSRAALRADPVKTLLPLFLLDINTRKLPVTRDQAHAILSYMIARILPIWKNFPATNGGCTNSPFGYIIYGSPLVGKIRLDGSRGRAMLALVHEAVHAIGFKILAAWFRDEQVVHQIALTLAGDYLPLLERYI